MVGWKHNPSQHPLVGVGVSGSPWPQISFTIYKLKKTPSESDWLSVSSGTPLFPPLIQVGSSVSSEASDWALTGTPPVMRLNHEP